MNGAIDLPRGLPALVSHAAREAGAMASRWFRPGERTSARIWTKGKSSPVTEADIEADHFLRHRLGAIEGRFGWLSEETADSPERLSRRWLFVVDPIDGTRAFLDGDPRWCVSIAVIADGKPVIAVVHAPSLNLTYEAVAEGFARLNGARIETSAGIPPSNARVAGPRFILDALAGEGGIVPVGKIPSLALRLCNVADGTLDAALASRDANDWDIAAAHLIVERAGGKLANFEGEVPSYNRATILHDRLLAAPTASFDPMLARTRTALGLPRRADAATQPH
jgi:myo-inositol-1(or 4)-monophosphatase